MRIGGRQLRTVLNNTANPIYRIAWKLLSVLRSSRRKQMTKTIGTGLARKKAGKTHLSSLGKRGTSCWSAGLLNGANIAPVVVHRSKLLSNNSASAHIQDVLKLVSVGAVQKFGSLSEDQQKTIVKRRARALHLASLRSTRDGYRPSVVQTGSAITSDASAKTQPEKSYAG